MFSLKNAVANFSALAMVAMSLAGCASFTNAREDHLRNVHPGQTEAEVSQNLGEPESKIERAGQQVWQYEIYTTDSRGRYPYSAYFENGKLLKIQMEQASYKDVANQPVKHGKLTGGFYSVSVRHGSYYDANSPGLQQDWRPGTSMMIDAHP